MQFVIHDPLSGRDIAPLLAVFPDLVVQPAIIDKTTPARGCLMSHQACIRAAKAAKAPWVHVLEDDCVLTPGWNRANWKKAIVYLLSSDAHVLNGGVLRLAAPGKELNGLLNTSAPKAESEGLVRGGQSWSTHFVVYKHTAFDRLLEATWERKRTPIDLLPGALGLQTLVTVPFVAVQSAGASAVARQEVDYAEEFARHETYLGQLNNYADYDSFLFATLGPIDHVPNFGPKLSRERKEKVVVKAGTRVCIGGVVTGIPKGRVAVPLSVAQLLRDSNALAEG